VLKDLYLQRTKFTGAPYHDPLPTETTFEAAGLTQASKGWIPFIPDAVTVDMLTKAFDWVTHHPEPILSACDTSNSEFEASNDAGDAWRQSSERALTALKLKRVARAQSETIDGCSSSKIRGATLYP
jgi:hypothetical protein